MSIIWTSRTRTKQPPQGPRLNIANPAARGIVDAWVGSTPGRTEKGQTPIIQTAGEFGSGVAGQKFTTTATGAKNGLRLAASYTSWFPSASTATIVICYRYTDTTARASALFGAEVSSAARILAHAPYSDNNLYFDFGNATSGSLAIAGFNKTTQVQTMVFIAGPTVGRQVWRDGYLLGSGASSTSVSGLTGPFALGTADIMSVGADGDNVEYYAFATLDREYSAAEAASVSRNPWQLFASERSPVFFSLPSSGGGSVTGTLNSSLAAATLSGVGSITTSGTLAVTLDAATLAGIGTAAVTNKTGTLAVTLADATLAGIGGVTRSATLAVTLDAATLAGVGSVAVGSNRDGTLASTLANATLAGIGGVTRSATLSVTLDAATLAGVGTAGQPRTGTLAVTLDNVTLSGIGAIPAAPSHGGGSGTGRNLSRKQKKKLKAVESQEWLKAEETARQILNDRFTKQTPKEKAKALETYIESLQPIIEALKALTTQIEDVSEAVDEIPVIETTPHQEILQRFDRLEKKVKSVEELIIILMADL